MFTPTTPAGLAGLNATIRDPRRALLAFDFDGVLSPIVDDPEEAQALPRVFPALAEVGQRVGSVAIITGRPVSFVTSRDGFSVLRSIPGFSIYGQYGHERWDAATQAITVAPPSNGIAAAREELAQLLQGPDVASGIWLEDKGSALAVHTRRAADPEGALAVLSEPVGNLARRHHLRVEPGKMVIEVRPPGVDKGDVLRSLAEDRAAGSVLYAGDDLGDLEAFSAVDELRKRGIPGIKICSGSSEAAEVAEEADLVVNGPAGIADLLEDLGRQIARGQSPR
jgi:trehalose 6-phosphate phosphatase